MRMLNEEPVRPSACPYCDTVLDCVNAIIEDGEAEDTQASPGAITICIKCAQTLIFNDDLSLRKLTTGEIRRIKRDPRAAHILWTLTTIVKKIDRRSDHERRTVTAGGAAGGSPTTPKR